MSGERAGAEGAADRFVRCRDGRVLCVREYGAPGGKPAFFFHGWPGSRLDFAPNAGAAAEAGVRVLALDRPGMGGSSRSCGRRVRDWAADVETAAGAFGLDRFAVIGFSFGGPYARACAWALRERVTRAILVSAVGPLDDPAAGERVLPRPLRLALALARVSPALALPLAWRSAREVRRRRPGSGLEHLAVSADAEVLRGGAAEALRAGSLECFRGGLWGAVDDAAAVAHGDGFAVEEIGCEVTLWHGELDRSDPVEMARSQERRIPRASGRYVADGGHLILFSHAREILAEVGRG